MKKVYSRFVLTRPSSTRSIPLDEIRSGSYDKHVSKEQSARIKKAGASALQQMRDEGLIAASKG